MTVDLPDDVVVRSKRVRQVMAKLASVVLRSAILLLAAFDVGLYMRAYTKYLRWIGLKIEGTPKFISSDVYFDGSDYRLISLGDNVVISREVMFLTHDYSITAGLAATGQRLRRGEGELYVMRPITVGSDCFIGARASLLPGTVLSDNVIVGAGSVVTGYIPANSIVAGNPARVIGETSVWTQAKLELGGFLKEGVSKGPGV